MTSDSQPTFADRVREFRTRRNLSQSDVGRALEVKPSYVSKWEVPGGKVPSRDVIDRLVGVLGLTDDERMELHRLAERVPEEVERFLVEQPAAVRLFRSVRHHSPERQAELLERFLAEVDREGEGAVTDEERTGPAGRPEEAP
jgi:transcriptional regulator with XRE-family HTH domain